MEFDLPDDIFYEISTYLESKDLLPLCLTSPRIYNILIHMLWSQVTLLGTSRCKTTLHHLLSSSPSSSSHIRYLKLEPNSSDDHRKLQIREEQTVVDLLIQLAREGKLSRLRAFVWAGVEAPDEQLWIELRRGCGMLSYVGTSVGIESHDLDSDSQLFQFRDLLGFELFAQQVKPWVKTANSLIGRDRRYHPLPSPLLSMLLVHSQNLHSLRIDGSSQRSQLWDLRPLIKHGRFPRLRYLCLSGLGETKGPQQNMEDAILLDEFLDYHSKTLEEISFTGAAYYSHLANQRLPHDGPTTGGDDGGFVSLKTFRGRASQIRDPQFKAPHLQSIVLLDYWSPKANLSWLNQLPPLTSLGLSINLADQGNLSKLLTVALEACTRLRHLELLVSTSVALTDITSQIRLHPHIHSFTLLRPRKQQELLADSKLLKAAEQLSHSSFEYFTIHELSSGDHENWLLGNFKSKAVVKCRLGMVLPNGKQLVCVRESGTNWKGQKITRFWSREID